MDKFTVHTGTTLAIMNDNIEAPPQAVLKTPDQEGI